MAKSLDDVLSAFTPEQRARVEARAQELIEEALTLRDLRKAQHLTQKRMAELLGVEQENVSRRHCQVNEKSLPDAFPLRKAEG